MTRTDPELEAMVAEASINAEVAQLIYEARTLARLTQKQLAELVGTKQPVIARLEDADYEGHSLSMLQKIARALKSAGSDSSDSDRTRAKRIVVFVK